MGTVSSRLVPSAARSARRRSGQGSTLWLDLHQVGVRLQVSCPALLAHCRSLFRGYLATRPRQAQIAVQLDLMDTLPARRALPPATTVVYRRHDIGCYADAGRLWIEVDGKAAFILDRVRLTAVGHITPLLMADPHLLNRLLVGTLVLLLRPRGIFPLHAFAAATGGRAVLLVGTSGSGKTTAGLSFLGAGWSFLANDLLLLSERDAGIQALSCPEQLHVSANTVSIFPELSSLPAGPGGKAAFHVEDIYPGCTVDHATVGCLLFPRVTPDGTTCLKPLSTPAALTTLLPHGLATWDRALAPAHFSLLSRLVQTAPAYQVDLGQDFLQLPNLVDALLKGLH